MKPVAWLIAAVIVLAAVYFLFFYNKKQVDFYKLLVHKPEGVPLTVPSTINEVTAGFEQVKKELIAERDKFIAASDRQSPEAFLIEFDQLVSPISRMIQTFELLGMVHPDPTMRQTAQDHMALARAFLTDEILMYKPLWEIVHKEALAGIQNDHSLNDEERYYADYLIKQIVREGLLADDATRAQIKQFKNESDALGIEFDANIAKDNQQLTTTKDQLAGCDPEFIKALPSTQEGLIRLGLDYPTVNHIMDNCSVSATRKAIAIAFNNRAYPLNERLLEQLVQKRHNLANILNFKSYADLQLAYSMAHTTKAVEQFITQTNERAQKKLAQELNLFKQNLPAGITLSEDGKFYSWDMRYIRNTYKKKHLDIDEVAIAEYFPMQQTIDNLLTIYSKFFEVVFKKLPTKGFWHDDVQLISVEKDGKLCGYVVVDLFPREGKYNHACCGKIISGQRLKDGTFILPVTLVIANFTKPTDTQPSLLMREEVKTFFHEFGHAIHNLFGITQFSEFSGTNVVTDFVEMPSQMLEEWLYEKEILKMVSHHYKTGESLPDALIEKIVALKKFDCALFMVRQLSLSAAAFDIYANKSNGTVHDIVDKAKRKYMFYIAEDPTDHFEASWGHLNGYAAMYYGYQWSNVYGLDLFQTIKEQGLLNPVIGDKYRRCILAPGGSKDPMVMITEFLGRKPSSETYFKQLE